MAVSYEAADGRTYSAVENEQVVAAETTDTLEPLIGDIPDNTRWFGPPLFGLKTYADLYTPRQLRLMNTLFDLISEAQEQCKKDAIGAGWQDDELSLEAGGAGAFAYSQAVALYLSLAVSKMANYQSEMFDDWRHKRDRFSDASYYSIDKGGQIRLFDAPTEKQTDTLFKQMKKYREDYPNYIYALTMGLGKTILMATCIFYEFLLAKKYPRDKRFCHNALVFAPDKTVLQSLREIMTFDKTNRRGTQSKSDNTRHRRTAHFMVAHVRLEHLWASAVRTSCSHAQVL